MTVLSKLIDSSRRFADDAAETRDLTPAELFEQGVSEGWWPYAQTASGRSVTAESAERMAAVYACIDLIATSHGMLPVEVQPDRRTGSDDDLEQPDWLIEPNPEMTWQALTEMQRTADLTAGESFYWVQTNPRTGDVVRLWPLNPRNVDFELVSVIKPTFRGDRIGRSREWHIHLTLDNGDQIRNVPRFDARRFTPQGILHVPTRRRPSSPRGISPIEHAAEVIGLSLAAEEHGARFFSNDATPGLLVSWPRDMPSRDERKRFKTSWNESHQGVGNSSKIGMVGGGAEIHQMTIPPQHAQFLETRRFQVEEVARIYRVPPHMIAANERQSTTGTSIEHQQIAFAQHTMGPHLRRLEAAFERFVLPEGQQLWHDTRALLRADTKTRIEANEIRIRSGQSTINEVRRDENEPPVENGDQVFVPLNNLVPLDRVNEVIDAQVAKRLAGSLPDPAALSEGGRPSSPDGTDTDDGEGAE